VDATSCARLKQTECYVGNKRQIVSMEFPADGMACGRRRPRNKAPARGGLHTRGRLLAAISRRMFLREKLFQPLRSNDQLTSVAHDHPRLLKTREILGNPRP
jgi:hypothetical protein